MYKLYNTVRVCVPYNKSKTHLSHDMTKPTKWVCAQWRLRSAWASTQSDQSLLCAQWVAKDPRFLHADREDSDQTGWMPRLIWVFAGRTLTLLVLSCRGSFIGKLIWFVLLCLQITFCNQCEISIMHLVRLLMIDLCHLNSIETGNFTTSLSMHQIQRNEDSST